MKILGVFLAMFALSSQSFAFAPHSECERTDLTLMTLALTGKKSALVKGEALKEATWELLNHDPAPLCRKLSPTPPACRPNSAIYELRSGANAIRIEIALYPSSVNSKTMVVKLAKANDDH